MNKTKQDEIFTFCSQQRLAANSFATIPNEILACIFNTIKSVLRNAQLSLKQCECWRFTWNEWNNNICARRTRVNVNVLCDANWICTRSPRCLQKRKQNNNGSDDGMHKIWSHKFQLFIFDLLPFATAVCKRHSAKWINKKRKAEKRKKKQRETSVVESEAKVDVRLVNEDYQSYCHKFE